MSYGQRKAGSCLPRKARDSRIRSLLGSTPRWRSVTVKKGKHVGTSAQRRRFPLVILEHLKKHLSKEKLLGVSLKTHPHHTDCFCRWLGRHPSPSVTADGHAVVLLAEPAEKGVSWGSQHLKLGPWQLPGLRCSFSFFI